ncbi:MAG: hypothetical protein HN348_30415 [Proteobacteria bacterium]|jgi:hypothetical protein|nr:hypothetical protein [Pseudomonadota bacterium]
MTILTSILAALLLSAPAQGASHELSFEMGTLHNGDENYDLFSGNNAIPTRGLRFGVAVHENVAVTAGWQHGARGSDIYLPDSEGGESIMTAAFFADEFTLGVKADYNIADIFFPYVKVDAMLFRGVMKFDDDPNDRFSPGQVQVAGLAPGGLAMGGFEIAVPNKSRKVPLTVAVHLEAGYGLVSRLNFGDYGQMKPGGFALRGGIGLRYRFGPPPPAPPVVESPPVDMTPVEPTPAPAPPVEEVAPGPAIIDKTAPIPTEEPAPAEEPAGETTEEG